MNLPTAQRYAASIVDWLTPHCERIEIAGSIRRGLPNCNDVDLVCIPKTTIERDMLGDVTSETNHLWQFLNRHVGMGHATFQSGGNQPGKFCILQLKKCQLDVFFAAPETFATRLLCRTGSKEHNIWLAQRALDREIKWQPYEGIIGRAGTPLPAASEASIYAHLGLAYIEPQNRESAWLAKHIDSGL